MTINGTDFGSETAAREVEYRREEVVNTATDGTRRVRPLRPVDKTTTFRIPRLTQTQFNSLMAIFDDAGAAEFSTNTFAVVDDYSQAYTCRLRGQIRARRRMGRFWSVEIPCWVEG